MSILYYYFMRVVNMLTLSQSELPKELLRLHSAPKQLHVSGDLLEDFMARPRIAVIGSRKVTPYGRLVTQKLTAELAKKGVVIISGLALGVDSIAHASCLQAGGATIAVLPSGLDKIYPSSHGQLGKEIVARGGLLVTEYPFNTEPRRENFIARNRIIAGLAEGLLITEAALNSGSLHTARFALELGIPVMAVPGPITSATSEGTNNLIKTGAPIITSVDDIFAAMNWKLTDAAKPDLTATTEPERTILELLSSGATDGSELLEQSKLETSAFQQALTMLEINGRIRPLGANHWTLS
jgi:DNA processing protein